VSWEECQKFLGSLNGAVPGLNLRLPTEAEWENACRAGTRTPFSFGANITTAQVNYYGQYPYAGGAKAEHLGKTVPLKSLPANPWGLFEMHGNVWEWCQDEFGPYQPGPVVDPLGVGEGEGVRLRVVRGGSWDVNAGGARSALRVRVVAGDRASSLGFRVARGRQVQQDKPASREER
jgi:formylglycine-generating enzyme required for sulfatase activity